MRIATAHLIKVDFAACPKRLALATIRSSSSCEPHVFAIDLFTRDVCSVPMDPLNPNVPSPGPATAASSGDKGRNVLRSYSLNQLVGVLFLVSQVIFVLQAHFLEESARLMSPVEGLTRYELNASLGQRTLTAAEIRVRYRIAFRDDVPLTVGALRAAIIHRETRPPVSAALYVRLRTREPGGTEDYWLWPQE